MRTLSARLLPAALVILLLGFGRGRNSSSCDCPERQKGISYATWTRGLYSSPDSDLSLVHLAETGANWISLIVTCYQNNLSSTQILAAESMSTDADLIHVIKQAHALGLKVM